MKISTLELRALIQEAVKQRLAEVTSQTGIDWENMRFLHLTGKLKGKWQVIMTAFLATGDPEMTLALLKSAVATLELHKNVQPAVEPSSEEEKLSMDSPDMM